MSTTPQPDRTAILTLPDDALLTPVEISVLLSLHVNTVLRLAKAQKLPMFALPLGQKRRVWRGKKSDIVAFGAPTAKLGQSSDAKLPVPKQKGAANGHSKLLQQGIFGTD